MKYRHYAPSATVQWLHDYQGPARLPEDVMALLLSRSDLRGAHVFALGSTQALAQQLYGRFRQADALGLRHILVEAPAPGAPLEQALRNRIQKAIARR
jgi:hypothetical protein